MDRRIHKIVQNRQKKQQLEREYEESKSESNASELSSSDSANTESIDNNGNDDLHEVTLLINKLEESDDIKSKPEFEKLSSMLKQLISKK